MRFLKTVFWTLVAVVAGIFSWNNWTDVQIVLWNDLAWYTKLPVPLLLAFLLGLLPAFLLHQATRWRLNRKLESSQRALANAQRPLDVQHPHGLENPPPLPLPPVATPIAVPPGVI